ncbi:cytochrome P450 [Nocardia sp. NPDC059240]|uniref:cytochrome P450 n=1 Tax=Nocardia sp. NPDC059240 TaxID=3346786 RepID=UPI003682E04C
MEVGSKVVAASGALPLIGHLLQLRTGLGFLESLPAQGDLVEVRIGTWKAIVVCDPDLTHQVLIDNRAYDMGGRVHAGFRKVLGNGVGTCSYHDHRRQRLLLQPAFHSGRFSGYSRIMTEQIARLVGSWHDGQTIDVYAEASRLTSRITAKALFVADSAGPAAAAVEESLADINRGVLRYAIAPLPDNFPAPWNRRFHGALARVRSAVDAVIDSYRRSGIDYGDVLSALLAARDEAGDPLSDAEIQDQVLTLLTAAIGTAATSLTWALHLLAHHPHILERLLSEVDVVLEGRIATWNDLPQLRLTQQILNESLRLYPPGWIFTRTVMVDTTLAGVPLPVGSAMIYSPYLIHHRADLFVDPDRFDPDRWGADQSTQWPRNAWIPFGAGARKCMGETFALAEETLALATIAARWTVQPVTFPPAPLKARLGPTLIPREPRLRLHQRHGTPDSE